jgi:membrane protease subunit HflK
MPKFWKSIRKSAVMNQQRSQFEPSPKQVGSTILIGLAALVVVYASWTGMYSVDASEQAVIMRFGKYHSTVGPGLHFKAPWIDQRFVVDQSERSLRLPFEEEEGVDPEDKLILTGDLYAAVVEWNVIWRVTDPKDYVINFNGDDGEVKDVIVAVARSVMYRAVGDYSAEELLTGKREEITQIALKSLSDRLSEFKSGIAITDLQMQRVTPPDSVKPAFDDVNASIQQRDQSVNEANRERNQLLPSAEAQRDRLIREAEGYASRKLAEAEGEISALLAKYESYKLAPDITRKRMYLEMMEKVIQQSGPKIILDSKVNGPLPLLNLSPQGAQAPNNPLTTGQR